MSLKKEWKKALLEIYKNDGVPPFTDKNFISMWEAFAKTQPSATSLAGATFSGDGLSGVPHPPVWDTLELNMNKFGIPKKYADKAVARMKKMFGDNPSLPEIGAFMSA